LALAALYPGGVPEGLIAKERNQQVLDWLRDNKKIFPATSRRLSKEDLNEQNILHEHKRRRGPSPDAYRASVFRPMHKTDLRSSIRAKTDFTVRLLDPASGRNRWVGNGEVSTEGGKGLIGRLTVSDSASSSHAVEALFNDLQSKRLMAAAK